MSLTEAITPGVHPGISREIYDSIPAVNQSRLQLVRSHSPAHALARTTEPPPESDAQFLGTLIHTGILEPAEFAKRYVVMPDFATPLRDRYEKPRATKEYKEKVAAFTRANEGREIVEDQEYLTMERILASLRQHRLASRLLDKPSFREATCIWEDPHTGIICKCLLDIASLGEDWSCILDVKSTQDASPRKFVRSIEQYRYFFQAAFYSDGLRYALSQSGITPPPTDYVILAVETQGARAGMPPVIGAVNTFLLDASWLNAGRDEYLSALKLWKRCVNTGVWPCYEQDLHCPPCPDWIQNGSSPF